jgi:lipoprotein-releasing system permease protein
MLFLAVKHMLSRPGQTLLILVGIAFGPFGFLGISGMMLGFREGFVNQLINASGHVKISAHDEGLEEHSLDRTLFGAALVSWRVPPAGLKELPRLKDPQGWYAILDHSPEMAAYAPQFSMQATVSKAAASQPVMLTGIQPAMQGQTSDIEKDFVDCKLTDLSKGGFQLVLGDAVRRKLGARKGDTLTLVDSRGRIQHAMMAGHYKTGIEQLDAAVVYAPLTYVQQFNGTPGRVSSILVRLHDVDLSDAAAARWSLTGRDKVQTWDQANGNIKTVFRMQDTIRFLMIGIILLVAGILIYSILKMMVVQKRGEIAILRSFGYEAADMVWLFLWQGLILSLGGAVLGLAMGTLLGLYVETLVISGPGLATQPMRFAFLPANYAEGFLLALVFSCLAAFLPAWGASRLDPIDILRTEG